MLSFTLLTLASLSLVFGADGDDDVANQYTQYPSVPKTASINGFADRIYAQVPSCAQECLRESTGSTPCPYWDTGCLCVMPQFAGAIGNCVAENCKGSEIGNFESLATSICSSAGVWEPYWMIPGSVSDALASAATAEVEATTTDEATTTAEETTEAAETTTAETTTAAEETTAAETTTAETTTAAEETTTAETTTAAEESTAAQESSKAEETTKAEESSKAESESASASLSPESSSISVEVANAGHMQTAGGVIAAVAAVAAFF